MWIWIVFGFGVIAGGVLGFGIGANPTGRRLTRKLIKGIGDMIEDEGKKSKE